MVTTLKYIFNNTKGVWSPGGGERACNFLGSLDSKMYKTLLKIATLRPWL